jgi:hypothetical protein
MGSFTHRPLYFRLKVAPYPLIETLVGPTSITDVLERVKNSILAANHTTFSTASNYANTFTNNQGILGYPKKLFQLGYCTLYKMSKKHAVPEMCETRLPISYGP